MTNGEAIEHLKRVKAIMQPNNLYSNAMDLALEALEKTADTICSRCVNVG